MVGNYNLLKMGGKNVKYKKTLSISFKKNSGPPAGLFQAIAVNIFTCFFTKIGKDKQGDIWNVTKTHFTSWPTHEQQAKEQEIYFDQLVSLKYLLFKNNNRSLTLKSINPDKSLIFEKVKDL